MSASGQHENGTILMVFMFRGNYLREKLGHEIINLFRADNRKHYIYVNPWGHVNENDYGKIETILLVRYVGNHKVKIIAKAWKLSRSYSGASNSHLNKNISRQELTKIKEGQMKDCDGIEYGRKTLADIFNFSGENDKQEILVTYEAGEFRRAKDDERLYVDYSNKEETGNPGSHSLKGYYPSNSNDKKKMFMYEKLTGIINDDTCWEEKDNSEKIDIDGTTKKQFNILNMLGKEDDELAFSNWFCYLFNKDSALLKEFAKKVLDCDLSSHAYVQREVHNIDLLITDLETNQLIVIENKIKSGINGKEKQSNPVMQTAFPSVEANKKTPKYRNQLHKYKEIAKSDIAKDVGLPDKTEPCCFVFLPDYNTSEDGICKEEGYTIVRYSTIYKFFEKKVSQLKNGIIHEDDAFDQFVLNEFVKALERHTNKYPDHLFEDTYRLFLETISKTQ